MSRIFINYRRSDSGGYAGRIYEALKRRSEAWQVFMDVDTIHAGLDFTEAIERAIQSADLMLVVIGKEWLVDADGRRRLDDPHDFVRIELEAALKSNVRMIPILIGEAKMPTEQELPPALAMLNRRQVFQIRDAQWQLDLGELLKRVDRALGEDTGQPKPTPNRSRPASGSWFRGVAEKLKLIPRP
jgi:hypothetical protein